MSSQRKCDKRWFLSNFFFGRWLFTKSPIYKVVRHKSSIFIIISKIVFVSLLKQPLRHILSVDKEPPHIVCWICGKLQNATFFKKNVSKISVRTLVVLEWWRYSVILYGYVVIETCLFKCTQPVPIFFSYFPLISSIDHQVELQFTWLCFLLSSHRHIDFLILFVASGRFTYFVQRDPLYK